MTAPLRRVRNATALLSVVVLGIGFGCLWLFGTAHPRQTPALVMHRKDSESIRDHAQTNTSVVPDDLRAKFDPRKRTAFTVGATQNASIFVLATGVEVLGESGWKTEAEEYRGEIWRLKAGSPREVCVERPESGTWRAYIRYGEEMTGPALLRAQLREAWTLRSVSNWGGKQWGGGRWAGAYETCSEGLTE